MEQETLFEISRQSRQAVEELLNAANLRAGDIFVIGCSSSEIVGGHIGKDSSMEAAKAVLDGVLPALKARGIYLAAQCCEHLNRAIVLERAAAEQYGYEQVRLSLDHIGKAHILCARCRPKYIGGERAVYQKF